MPTTTEYHNNGIVKAITEFDGNYVRSGTRLEFDRHGPYVEYDNTGAASGLPPGSLLRTTGTGTLWSRPSSQPCTLTLTAPALNATCGQLSRSSQFLTGNVWR